MKRNLPACFSPQSPGVRLDEAGHRWALPTSSPVRCSSSSGCPRQMWANLPRALCLQPQVVRPVLKRYRVLLEALQSLKNGVDTSNCGHTRGILGSAALCLFSQCWNEAGSASWGDGLCSLSTGVQYWDMLEHVGLERTNGGIFK